MSDLIVVGQDSGILRIGMNRPDKKNALNREMYDAMVDALQRADRDSDIRAILIAGTPGAFSAGADIQDFIAYAMGEPRMGEVGRFLEAICSVQKPLVAAVDGLAIGIGTTMLMHCDLVFATPRSLFRTPFLDLGLVPEAGSSLLAPRLMGAQRAFALLVMGEAFDANAAKDANLIYAIADEAEVEAKAQAAAAALARKPPEALRIARDLLRGDRQDILERVRLETRYFSERLRTDEARAAFTAFMNRSKAG